MLFHRVGAAVEMADFVTVGGGAPELAAGRSVPVPDRVGLLLGQLGEGVGLDARVTAHVVELGHRGGAGGHPGDAGLGFAEHKVPGDAVLGEPEPPPAVQVGPRRLVVVLVALPGERGAGADIGGDPVLRHHAAAADGAGQRVAAQLVPGVCTVRSASVV